MNIDIRKAESSGYASQLTQENMKVYYKARNLTWDPALFAANWHVFENKEVYFNAKRVGVLRLSFGDSNCYIRDVQIEPEYQGLGIGKQCLSYIVEYANTRNDIWIKLRVFAENPASNLYRRFGFKVLAESNGLIEMGLELNATSVHLSVFPSPPAL